MDEATIRALCALYREFYEEASAEFSATRRHPWAGWYQIVPALEALAARAASLRVLDVGCGNGRFARFLSDALDAPLLYVGLDASAALLDEARRTLRGDVDAALHVCDVATDDWERPLGAARFDLVALFGVLHHLPGRPTRRALLERLAARVAESGLLVFTVFRFAHFERFRARLMPWPELERLSPEHAARIDLEKLEPGDHLLRWGPGAARARYCHFVDADELRELIDALPLECVASFESDGKTGDLNSYVLLRRR